MKMKKYLVLLALVMLFMVGCAREEAPEVREVPPVTITHGEILTEEREEAVREHIDRFKETGMFEFYTMLENGKALEVWIDVGDEPITDNAVKGLTDGLIRELAALFDNKVPIRLTALQKSGSEFIQFGTSVFSPKTEEVTYESR